MDSDNWFRVCVSTLSDNWYVVCKLTIGTWCRGALLGIFTTSEIPNINIPPPHLVYRIKMTSQTTSSDVSLESFISVGGKSKVFKDTKYFGEDYIPLRYLKKYRSKQIQAISDKIVWVIDPNGHNERGENNIFVYGPPSTGKTHVVKALSHQYNNDIQEIANRRGRDPKSKVIYVSASNVTATKVIYMVAKQFNDDIPRRGISSDEVLERTAERMKGMKICLILDELDKVNKTKQYTKPVNEILRKFLDLQDGDEDINISFVVVVNDQSTLNDIGQATDSRFVPKRKHFPKYTAKEIADILHDRCKKGFVDGVVSKEDIEKLGKNIRETGRDIRTGLKVLLECGRRAENKGWNDIIWGDMKQSLKEVERTRLSKSVSRLDNTELLVYHAMAAACDSSDNSKNKNYTVSGELKKTYKSLCQQVGVDTLTWHHIVYYTLPPLEQQGLFIRHKGTRTESAKYEVDEKLRGDIIDITDEEIQNRLDNGGLR